MDLSTNTKEKLKSLGNPFPPGEGLSFFRTYHMKYKDDYSTIDRRVKGEQNVFTKEIIVVF